MTHEPPSLPSGLVIADRALDGRLAELLADWRSLGLAWERIASRLYAETGGRVDVTGPTVSDWADRLDIAA